jgi:hypothetical protein
VITDGYSQRNKHPYGAYYIDFCNPNDPSIPTPLIVDGKTWMKVLILSK